jgi:hypothetical protein
MRERHGGLGIFVLPLTPHHVAVLGQGSQSRRATADEVNRFNTLQVRLAYRHVHFKPAAGLAGFVFAAWRQSGLTDDVRD